MCKNRGIIHCRFLGYLGKEKKKSVIATEVPSKSLSRFGDGVESKAWIFSILVTIKYLYMLLRITLILISMSRMGMKTDFSKHNFVFDGQVIDLKCNSSGHYCLPVASLAWEKCMFVFHMESLSS